MTFSNPDHNQKTIEELEAEIHQQGDSPDNTAGYTPKVEWLPPESDTASPTLGKITDLLSKLPLWFMALPKTGQIVVAIAGVFLSLYLLKIVINLVTAVISLAILAVVAYGVYRFFASSQTKP